MESPGSGLPLTEFPLHQTHYSFSCQPAPGACNANIYKLNDGENAGAHPVRQQGGQINVVCGVQRRVKKLADYPRALRAHSWSHHCGRISIMFHFRGSAVLSCCSELPPRVWGKETKQRGRSRAAEKRRYTTSNYNGAGVIPFYLPNLKRPLDPNYVPK